MNVARPTLSEAAKNLLLKANVHRQRCCSIFDIGKLRQPSPSHYASVYTVAMSALGQQQTFAAQQPMSALPPESDVISVAI